MIDTDCLPIPDWGLRCPRCDAPLVGMPQHRCRRCGHAFNIRHLLGRQRPIPDLGLTCPECGYLLTGLIEERCPECGKGFSVRAILEDESPMGAICFADTADPDAHHIKKREPTLSGSERPMPEFGLVCSSCDHPLAGTTEDNCPRCGEPFDLFALVPDRDWINIAEFVPRDLHPLAKNILYDAEIPYVVDNAALNQLYTGAVPFVSSRLSVPREFFFDALHAFTAAGKPPPDYAEGDWTCPACSEHVPPGFELCWNCNASHPDHLSEP